MFGQCRRRKTCKEIITSVKVVCLLSEINFRVSQLNQFSVLTQKRMDPSSVTVLSTFTENFCSNTRDLSKNENCVLQISWHVLHVYLTPCVTLRTIFCTNTWGFAHLPSRFCNNICALWKYRAPFAEMFVHFANVSVHREAQRIQQKQKGASQVLVYRMKYSNFAWTSRGHHVSIQQTKWSEDALAKLTRMPNSSYMRSRQ